MQTISRWMIGGILKTLLNDNPTGGITWTYENEELEIGIKTPGKDPKFLKIPILEWIEKLFGNIRI